MYYIFSDAERKFWSVIDGWVDLKDATDYTDDDRVAGFDMPRPGGYWVSAKEAKDLDRIFGKG